MKLLHKIEALDEHLLPVALSSSRRNAPAALVPPTAKTATLKPKKKKSINKPSPRVKATREAAVGPRTEEEERANNYTNQRIRPDIASITLKPATPAMNSGSFVPQLLPPPTNTTTTAATVMLHLYRFVPQSAMPDADDCRNKQLEALKGLVMVTSEPLGIDVGNAGQFWLHQKTVNTRVPKALVDDSGGEKKTLDAEQNYGNGGGTVGEDVERMEVDAVLNGGSNNNDTTAPAAIVPIPAANQPQQDDDGNDNGDDTGEEGGKTPMISVQLWQGASISVAMLHHGSLEIPTSSLNKLYTCSKELMSVAFQAQHDDYSFLLLPCVPPDALADNMDTDTSLVDIDWQAVEQIAQLAADKASNINVLSRIDIDDENSLQCLEGKVIVTDYNKFKYEAKELLKDMNLLSRMVRQSKKRKQPCGATIPDDKELQLDVTGHVNVNTSATTNGSMESSSIEHQVQAVLTSVLEHIEHQEQEEIISTFAEYYEQRWNKTNLINDQPLISAARVSDIVLQAKDIPATWKRSGRLIPSRYKGNADVLTNSSSVMKPISATAVATDSNVNSHRDSAATPTSSAIHLVPELCFIHPVPCALWPGLAAFHMVLRQVEGLMSAQELLQHRLLMPRVTVSVKVVEEEGEEQVKDVGCNGDDGDDAMNEDIVDITSSANGKQQQVRTTLQITQAWQQPSVHLIRSALTARSAHDSLFTGDMESLETVGDAFLKYATSAYLYCQYTQLHEGQLHRLRLLKVCNAALVKIAVQLELQHKIRAVPLSRKQLLQMQKKTGEEHDVGGAGDVIEDGVIGGVERVSGFWLLLCCRLRFSCCIKLAIAYYS